MEDIQTTFNRDCLKCISEDCIIENIFTVRKHKPKAGNKYYIRTENGGYNKAIKGKPLDKDCDVLANCVRVC